MKLSRKVGSTSQIFQIFIQDSSSTTGAGLTGLVFNSGSLTAYYHRDTDTTATVITLVTMTVGTFTSSGFKEIDATNMPGWYQFCPPNAAFNSGAASVAFHLKGATNMAPLPIEVDLDSQVDVTHWNGTAVATPATAGIPEVNVKNINNVSAGSVTTVNANVGTTQPTNFTGTGASALVKGDTVDIAGATVSTTSAQIGVNVVQINAVAASSVTAVNANIGTTQPVNFTGTAGSALVKSDTVDIAGSASVGAAGFVGVDWGQVTNKTTTNALTGTTISTSQVVASVTGAVGSVTGAVGSVTGNVGGNVVGSVGSVVGNIGGNLQGTLTTTERNAIADALLDRDMSVGTDSGSSTVRTVRQALRFLRNLWAIVGSTLSVYKEDDVTVSWTSTLTTTPGVDPVTKSDPAGP